jgi:hypothetical protein
MAASTGTIGYGGVLEYATVGGSNWAALAQTKEIDVPDIKVKAVDKTNNDSPNATMERFPGLIDPGQAKVTLVYKKSVYVTLLTLLRVVKDWRITFSDATSTATFTGFIVNLARKSPLDETEMLDVTIEATGLPVVA